MTKKSLSVNIFVNRKMGIFRVVIYFLTAPTQMYLRTNITVLISMAYSNDFGGNFSNNVLHTASEPCIRINSMNQHFGAKILKYIEKIIKNATFANYLASTTIGTS